MGGAILGRGKAARAAQRPVCDGTTVALVGNRGAGKTALFERLVGGGGDARGIPGSRGTLKSAPLSVARAGRRFRIRGGDPARPPDGGFVLLDTPGAALFFSQNGVDEATRRLLLSGEPDSLLFVADAKNLRRSLILFLQIAELQLPTAFVLNMTDEADQLGCAIDQRRLAAALKIPLCAALSRCSDGAENVRPLLGEARIPPIRVAYPRPVESALNELVGLIHNSPIAARALALMLLCGNPLAERLVAEALGPAAAAKASQIVAAARRACRAPLDAVITDAVSAKAEEIASQVTVLTAPQPGPRHRLGGYTTHPVLGPAIALLVLACGYLWVGVLGAGIAVDLIENRLLRGVLLPLCGRALSGVPWPPVRDAILDPSFGLLPNALFLAVGVALPVLILFYVFFGALENSGYMPRLSMLLDRRLRFLGLTGKGVLPLALGMSCVAVAVMGTNVLESRKERLIATFLLMLSFPCAQFLAVILVVLARLPASATAFLFGVLAIQSVAAGVLANRIIPGPPSDFILELSPLRFPRPLPILGRALRSSLAFLKEALPIFIGVSLLFFALDRLGALAAIERLAQPFVHGVLGLPDQAVQVFVKTIIRRVNGASELAVVQGQFSPLQIVTTLFVMITFSPCVNTTMVVFKEHGAKAALSLLAIAAAYSVLAGAGLNLICNLLHITFA